MRELARMSALETRVCLATAHHGVVLYISSSSLYKHSMLALMRT